jgi:hypothetical protein
MSRIDKDTRLSIAFAALLIVGAWQAATELQRLYTKIELLESRVSIIEGAEP